MDGRCDELIARIEDEAITGDRDDRTRAFFIEACGEIAHLLPPEGARWMEVAEAYLYGAGSKKALIDARLEASAFTDADLQGTTSPRSAAVSAVLLALTPDEGYDPWGEAVGMFIDLCGRAGADREALCRRLRETFADELEERDPD